LIEIAFNAGHEENNHTKREEEMNEARREYLKLGVGAVAAGLISSVGQEALGENMVTNTELKFPALANSAALRIATFSDLDGTHPRIGVVTSDHQLIDIQAVAQHHKSSLPFDPTSILSLLHSGEPGIQSISELVATAKTQGHFLPLSSVLLMSPIPKPQANIYCVGWNYLDHFEEGKDARADKTTKEYPTVPVFFSKGTQTMNGPFSSIPYDADVSSTIDWEAELAVIIGRKGRNIPESQAMDYVFGYSAFNDTTARDIQQKRHSGQWFKGKSLDGHGPMGPWIVTKNGVNLDETRVICRVNGVEKQNASYQQMYFKIPVIIAELSRGLTLLPGDIIATGTPSGVGYSRKPPEFLKPGDVMETEITSVGVIRNTIA
jgi:2-keto-4-pentenoate hydratase/2-oxohepta-3-ene-1,7-dioic acid hydratase in catechol pathway